MIAVHMPTVVQRLRASSSGEQSAIAASFALMAGTSRSRTSNML